MRRHKWTITTYTTGKKREVQLVVYGTLGMLRREATRWAKRLTPDDADFHNALGVCHGVDMIRVHADGTETDAPHAATIRLAVGSLTALIVSHEIAHAAQHLYRLDVLGHDSTDLAKDHFDAGNENFAQLYGELFSAAWETLTAAGLIETRRIDV